MRLLFVTRKFPPSVGGMEKFSYDLSQALAAKTDMTLVAWGGTGRIKAVVIALPYLFVRAFLALCRGGIDVIHVNDGLLAPSGYLLSRLFRKPFVVVIHGLDITYKNPLFRAVVPWSVKRADAVCCISQATAQQARLQGVPESKIKVINLAVQDDLAGRSNRTDLLKKLDLPADAKILLTVGRLVKRKGVAWFIDNVLGDLVKNNSRLMYLVVGEGQERPAIEAAIKRTGLEAHVRLLGRAKDELYTAAYNGADVFVMPNINVPDDMEGFGLVVLEAALCKLPVVAADTEGIRDAIIDGRNGYLVPVGDAQAFQERINLLLANSDQAAKFGEQARAYTVAHYQWEAIADRYLSVYLHLAPHTP